jgi:glucokinase
MSTGDERTLVADVGGTSSRFALAHAQGGHARLERISAIHNDTVPDLETAVAKYLGEAGARPRAATFAIAGPIDGEDIALTNRAWRFRVSEFGKKFGFASFRVINDFEAVAWALTLLGPGDTRRLGTEPSLAGAHGDTAKAAPKVAPKVALGPGTGLGVAALIPVAGRWQVLASEGGHASFGPQAPDEFALFARLHEECAQLSAEMVLSGHGLVRLARALDKSTAYAEPEAILKAALAGEPKARAAATMFIRLLARFAGGVALTFKALGGVYIAGGVSHGLAPLIDEAQFRAAFEAHPPHAVLLKAIPTLLVTYPEPGLLGCAAASENMREPHPP